MCRFFYLNTWQDVSCAECERRKIYASIYQSFVFSERECQILEACVDNVVRNARLGMYKELTVDFTPYRNK